MSDNNIASARVIAVLLADGWHRIVRGSFSVGPLGLGAGADLSVPGFWFEEADADSPNRPTVLAGPMDSIIAVRQVPPAVRRIDDRDRAWAARSSHRTDHTARLPVRASR